MLLYILELFKELCEECQLKKRKLASKGRVVKPVVSKEFNSRGQMDLIDMQSLSYNDHRYIMVYQDNMTKFVVLWSLKSKRTTDVAMQILDIFLLFGAPNILQSDNGAEFTASIISQLKDVWPGCKIVHGKPRHPQSEGSVEWANADIRDMTVTWMHENSCKD
jgi:transposase InsO family protein